MSEKEVLDTSELFSNNYGIWSQACPYESKRGQKIKYSASRIQNEFVQKNDRYVIMAYVDNELAGHIFYLKRSGPKTRDIIFVLQLVVAEKYRKHKIATRMMKSIWQLSNCYAWGLFTSNPMTIKVLESATMRKVDIKLINKKLDKIREVVKDVFPTMDWFDKYENGMVATDFYVDHTDLNHRIKTSYNGDIFPFSHDLEEGKEWLAITFASQKPTFSSIEEWEEYLKYSQEDIMSAYSNMKMDTQAWTQNTIPEVDFLTSKLIQKDDLILDIGCGYGRHSLELHKRGYKVIGVDFSEKKIIQSTKKFNIDFLHCADIREYKLKKKKADVSLCLYDVVGSFPLERDNLRILHSANRNLKRNGKIALSVMNMELTRNRCKQIVTDVRDNVDALLDLESSNTMQETGDVFNGKKILIDEFDGTVYRKEQFTPEDSLPCEMIVRDRRYTISGIQKLLNKSGFIVDETFFFKAGKLDKPLSSSKGKEIFVIAHKANLLMRLIMKLYPMPEAWKN